MRMYDKHVRELKEMADEWAGVCLRCFKDQEDQEHCVHPKPKKSWLSRPRTPDYPLAPERTFRNDQ